MLHPQSDARFEDRFHAGRELGDKLARAGYAGREDVVVLALPRGGVPVAFEVAQRLGAPMDVFLVRKLGVPGHEELAMGAIASGGVKVLNQRVVDQIGIPESEIDRVARQETAELARRERAYRGSLPAPSIQGRTVILIDDGLATGASMRAAAEAVRKRSPEKIVVAVPVASPETCEEFRRLVDEVVCLLTPLSFSAVGIWYEHFDQTSDQEVRELLDRAAQSRQEPVPIHRD